MFPAVLERKSDCNLFEIYKFFWRAKDKSKVDIVDCSFVLRDKSSKEKVEGITPSVFIRVKMTKTTYDSAAACASYL